MLFPEDVIFAQYRETGVFQQRGFTLANFMNQLFANCKDNGKGRNMPVHYGSSELNIVRLAFQTTFLLLIVVSAHYFLTFGDPDPPSGGRGVRSQNAGSPEPQCHTSHRSLLLW